MAPPSDLNLNPEQCAGANYLGCFKKYWSWTQTDGYKSVMRDVVLKTDFLENNYLSTDARIPVTLLRTNICSPLATNALAGNIWDNFSSHSYKELPSVGRVTLYHPFTGEHFQYLMPASGRGCSFVADTARSRPRQDRDESAEGIPAHRTLLDPGGGRGSI